MLLSIFERKIHLTTVDEEWHECKIKTVLQIMHGRDYKSNNCNIKTYPVLGTGGIIDYCDSYLCDWPCVLIGRKGTIDKPQYMDTPFWTVDTLFYSKPKPHHNPLFQYYLFQTINWKKYNEASGVPSQSASTIESITVSVPNEKTQIKIAQFFRTLDKKIDCHVKRLDALINLKHALIQKIFI